MEKGKPGSRGMDFRVVGNKHWRDGIAWQGRLYGYVSKADQWYEAVRAAKTGGILQVQYAGVLEFHEQEVNSIGCISPISHRGQESLAFRQIGGEGIGGVGRGCIYERMYKEPGTWTVLEWWYKLCENSNHLFGWIIWDCYWAANNLVCGWSAWCWRLQSAVWHSWRHNKV